MVRPLLYLTLLTLPLTAQTTFQVTASIQSRETTTANFGKLPSRYFAADWTITSNSTTAIKVPLAWVIQQVQTQKVIPANVNVLGPTLFAHGLTSRVESLASS